MVYSFPLEGFGTSHLGNHSHIFEGSPLPGIVLCSVTSLQTRTPIPQISETQLLQCMLKTLHIKDVLKSKPGGFTHGGSPASIESRDANRQSNRLEHCWSHAQRRVLIWFNPLSITTLWFSWGWECMRGGARVGLANPSDCQWMIIVLTHFNANRSKKWIFNRNYTLDMITFTYKSCTKQDFEGF